MAKNLSAWWNTNTKCLQISIHGKCEHTLSFPLDSHFSWIQGSFFPFWYVMLAEPMKNPVDTLYLGTG